MDSMWTATPQPLLFPHGIAFEVSGIVRCSVSHIVDAFDHSPAMSARTHELIVERFGRSVRVQGFGPVSVSCVLRVA